MPEDKKNKILEIAEEVKYEHGEDITTDKFISEVKDYLHDIDPDSAGNITDEEIQEILFGTGENGNIIPIEHTMSQSTSKTLVEHAEMSKSKRLAIADTKDELIHISPRKIDPTATQFLVDGKDQNEREDRIADLVYPTMTDRDIGVILTSSSVRSYENASFVRNILSRITNISLDFDCNFVPVAGCLLVVIKAKIYDATYNRIFTGISMGKVADEVWEFDQRSYVLNKRKPFEKVRTGALRDAAMKLFTARIYDKVEQRFKKEKPERYEKIVEQAREDSK